MDVIVRAAGLPPVSLAPREDVSQTPCFVVCSEARFDVSGEVRRRGGGNALFTAAVIVPAGFICDKASISGLSIITPKRMERPAVCHDYLYRHGCAALLDGQAPDGGRLTISGCDADARDALTVWLRAHDNGRRFADAIFRAHMSCCRTLTPFQAWRAWRAVRLFGASSYRNPRMAVWAADCAAKIKQA